MFPSRRRRGGGNFGLLMLGASLFRVGVDKVPPVTLAFVALNAGVFMRLLPNIPRVLDACVSNQLVFRDKQYIRLLLASFYHLDDMHLYYNMASFIYKGMKLEPKFGSRRFFIMLLSFALSSQLLLLLLNIFAAEIFSNRSHLTTCAAGFSAVLFALKVLMTHYSDGERTSLMGIPLNIPTKYAFWAELIVIQILVPNASFTGHLAGILAGLAYIKGPLKKFVDIVDGFLSGSFPGFPASRNPSYTYRADTVGSPSANPSSSRATRQPANDEERELQEALRRSIRDYKYESQHGSSEPHFASAASAPAYGWSVSSDETDSYQTKPTHHQTNPTSSLYPNLPNYSEPEPSAPPLENDDETFADSEQIIPNKTPSHEEIRQIRLRKYDKSLH